MELEDFYRIRKNGYDASKVSFLLEMGTQSTTLLTLTFYAFNHAPERKGQSERNSKGFNVIHN